MEETAPHIYQDVGIALGPEYVGKGYKALVLSCGFTYQYAEKRTDLRNGKPYQLEVYHKGIEIQEL